MRRFIALLLLCLLPFQFVLAASVDAMKHADGGHHHDNAPHSHDVDAAATTNPAGMDESSARAHGECGACHFFHSLAMLESCAEFKRVSGAACIDPSGRDDHHRSAVSERPERPNWSALV